jgi:hypothetical protein
LSGAYVAKSTPEERAAKKAEAERKAEEKRREAEAKKAARKAETEVKKQARLQAARLDRAIYRRNA